MSPKCSEERRENSASPSEEWQVLLLSAISLPEALGALLAEPGRRLRRRFVLRLQNHWRSSEVQIMQVAGPGRQQRSAKQRESKLPSGGSLLLTTVEGRQLSPCPPQNLLTQQSRTRPGDTSGFVKCGKYPSQNFVFCKTPIATDSETSEKHC